MRDYKHHECPWLDDRTAFRIRLGRLKFGGRQVDSVPMWVESHGACAAKCLHGLHNLIPSRPLACDRKGAITAACEEFVTIQLGRIHSLSNGEIGEHLAIFGIHHNQLLWISAANDQSTILPIDRNPDR